MCRGIAKLSRFFPALSPISSLLSCVDLENTEFLLQGRPDKANTSGLESRLRDSRHGHRVETHG